MIGTTVTFNAITVLLVAAVALFVLAAFTKIARGWFIPIGLAAFAGAFLAQQLT